MQIIKSNTKTEILGYENLIQDYALTIQVNSWKDGDITVDLTDSNGLKVEETFTDTNRIISRVKDKVKLILNGNALPNKEIFINKNFYSKFGNILKHAIKLKGELTHNFHEHDCHGKLTISAVY